MIYSLSQKAFNRAGTMLGVGLGMFFDGIVLHEILQWHHMVSGRRSPETLRGLQLNLYLDGFFQASAWVVTAVGLLLLFRAGRVARRGGMPSGRHFFGSFLLGWGGFNVVESILNHFIFRLHHVREGVADVLAYDLLFLVVMGFGVTWLGFRLRSQVEAREVQQRLTRIREFDPRLH